MRKELKKYSICQTCNLPKKENDHRNHKRCCKISFKGKKRSIHIGEKIKRTKSKLNCSHSVETKNKISQSLKGSTPWNKGKNCPQLSKENHWNWQGGKTPVSMLIRNSPKYRRWRNNIFKRDNYTCQKCGKYGGNLEAHHLIELCILIKENNIKTFLDAINSIIIWDEENGQTLCEICHNKTKLGINTIKKEGICVAT